MGKSNFQRVFALFLALYLPLAMVGFPLQKHYCEGHFQRIKMIFDDSNCHEDEEILEQLSCCGDVDLCHEGDEEEKSCCEDKFGLLKAELDCVYSDSKDLGRDKTDAKQRTTFHSSITEYRKDKIFNNPQINIFLHCPLNGNKLYRTIQVYLC